MKFTDSTKWQLKKVMSDLNYEASEYDWGSEEYEFLTEIVAEIEDAVWRVNRWKNQFILLLKIV